MLIHHLATSSLIASMVFSNTMTIGCSIAFLHDVADITVTLTKYYGQTPNDIAAAAWMIANMGLWFYTRELCLGYLIYIIYSTFQYRPDFMGYQPITWISGTFLFFLWLLHIYWFKIFIVMMYRAIVTGKAEDI